MQVEVSSKMTTLQNRICCSRVAVTLDILISMRMSNSVVPFMLGFQTAVYKYSYVFLNIIVYLFVVFHIFSLFR